MENKNVLRRMFGFLVDKGGCKLNCVSKEKK